MNQKSINIHELIMTVCTELEKFGYQQYYVWGHYFVVMNTIEKFHHSHNCQDYNSELTAEFLAALCRTMGLTLHVRQNRGENTHHIIEAVFKGLARALKEAVTIDKERENEIPSSKGVL